MTECPNYNYIGQRTEINMINDIYEKTTKTIFACKNKKNNIKLKIDIKKRTEKTYYK